MWTSLSLRPTRGTMQKQRGLVRLGRKGSCTMASSFLSKDQRFLKGMTRTQGSYMCAEWANQAGLNFQVDSEGADHTSVSRSDRTLNVYNYALQMHLCLQLFPGCLSGSVLEIPQLAEEVSRLSLFFFSEQDYCWQEALCSRSCPTQPRKYC